MTERTDPVRGVGEEHVRFLMVVDEAVEAVSHLPVAEQAPTFRLLRDYMLVLTAAIRSGDLLTRLRTEGPTP